MLAFDMKDGKFLWQHSSEKLPAGRVLRLAAAGHLQRRVRRGRPAVVRHQPGRSPLRRHRRLPRRRERRPVRTKRRSSTSRLAKQIQAQAAAQATQRQPQQSLTAGDDIRTICSTKPTSSGSYDMMKEMGISQHNMCSCSVTAAGDVLFVCTSNGVDVEHNYIPAPEAPSFFAMDKNTGKVLWTDNSPGLNIHHGQWSSPAYAEIDGQAQVIFGGGDGWLYSFDPEGDGDGKSKLLWKFDTNPKTAKLELMGKGTRNDIIARRSFYDGLVYVATGQDPEHGEGRRHAVVHRPQRSAAT